MWLPAESMIVIHFIKFPLSPRVYKHHLYTRRAVITLYEVFRPKNTIGHWQSCNGCAGAGRLLPLSPSPLARFTHYGPSAYACVSHAVDAVQMPGFHVPSKPVLDKASLKELLECEDKLNSFVVGQTAATRALSEGFLTTCNPRYAPIKGAHRGVYIFGGPTGTGVYSLVSRFQTMHDPTPAEMRSHLYARTGKSELAKCIPKALPSFFPRDAFLNIPMNNFRHDHEDAKLFGSPPGYVGSDQPGILEKFIEKHDGRGVILFDEFEKAAPGEFKPCQR